MIRRLLPIALLVLIVLISSCENNAELIKKSDFLNYPSASGRDIVTIMRDSGKLKLILKSPLLEQYDNGDSSYSEFREGIKVDYFDGDTVSRGSVSAKYAKYTKNDNTWLLKDSVVVYNENHERLETELLYWDQIKDRIFTDRFVKITTEETITQGFGFESDSHLNHREIRNVSAVIYIDNDSIE